MELFKSRPRVAYTNAVGDKVYPVVVDIKKGIKSTEDIQFVSSDVNTGILSVAFIQGNDNYNVTGADVVCSVMRPDASTLELPCEVVGENIVEVPLGINGTSQDGVYSFDFKVFKGENKVVGTPIMSYSVSLSIDNDTVVEEDDRLPVLTVLMTQLTELKGEARESITQANTATVASREATAKAIEATANANTVSERVSQETSEAISRVDNKVNEVETRFNALTTSQQQDAEVIDARDGEVSLKARLDRDIEKAKQVYVELEGSYISTESSTGAIQDLEILGNTVQDPNNLSDIKSVGELQEDGTYKMSILSCGKNLFNPLNKNIEYSLGGSQNKVTYKVEGDKIIIKSNPSVSSDWGWVEFKNIKVTPNKSYTIHPNATVIKGNVCVFVFDSNNTKLFEIPNTSKTFIPTTKHITIRLYVQTTTSYTDAEIHYKPQLEEGTQATPYEPYQENKCDILLPCQLEKVGEVSDRLFRREDGVWGVEKNIYTVTSDCFYQSSSKQLWYLDKTKSPSWISKNIWNEISNMVMCNYYSEVATYNEALVTEGIFIDHKGANPNIIIGTNDTNINSLPSDLITKYQLTEPQFIPLPRDTQIALNSFFGTTHIYMESGEVEGTIKCKIPKSLGATVQSLNNKTDILSDRIEAIEGLKDSQNMKYETDKGYLVCKETKNGVIDDLKIEGKTLVNLANCSDVSTSVNINTTIGKSVFNFLPLIKNIENGKTYTSIITCSVSNFSSSSSGYMYSEMTYNNTDSVKKWLFSANSGKINANGTFTLIDKFSINDFKNILEYHLYSANGVVATVKLERVLLLEGDHTQNPPSYFEGLMSVGEDVDEIVVESVNSVISQILKTNIESSRISHKINPIKEDFIIINPYTSILNVVVFEGGNWVRDIQIGIGRHNIELSENEYVEYINQYFENGWTSGDADLIKNIGAYTKQDKKQILFYNENGELEPIQELHEWDSIEKHSDNKWYYHKRSGKIVLDGSESVVEESFSNIKRFKVSKSGIKASSLNITNKYPSINNDTEFINSNYSIAIRTSTDIIWLYVKDVTITKDIAKTYCNGLSVVYQLAQEEVYELAPLHLDSYANETLILCNSGAISPKMEFSITSHINELVKSQGDRISLLEEKMYKALKQVLAGDMYSLAELLYPEDFVEENPENEIMLLPFE